MSVYVSVPSARTSRREGQGRSLEFLDFGHEEGLPNKEYTDLDKSIMTAGPSASQAPAVWLFPNRRMW